MSYQSEFLEDKYAQIAVQMGVKPYHVAALALYLMDQDRIKEKGKPMSEDHMRQVLAKHLKEFPGS